MPRRPRIHLSGLPLHIVQRGHNRDPLRAAMVDDPAHYRWSSYRANGLGQSDRLLTPHAVYSALGANDIDRQETHRTLFRPERDAAAIGDIRLALDQGQPVGDSRFIEHIERVTGQRRESRPRGRPRQAADETCASPDQLPLAI